MTLTVSYPSGELANLKSSTTTFRPIANVNFAGANSGSPILLSVGAKVHNDGLSVIAQDSDQLDGQIDNVYLSIPKWGHHNRL